MNGSEDATPPEPEPSPRPFTTIRRTRSFDEVVRQIQDAVVERRLSSGDRLPNERDLCRLFEVSRPTLREALRTLEVLGILEIRPGKSGGIFVAEPSGDSAGSALAALIRLRGATAAELNEFRTSFEGETAALAARRAERDDIEHITRVAAAARVSAEHRETRWHDMVEADIEFHEAVAHASKSEVRVAVMLGLVRALQRIELTISPMADTSLHRSVGAELTAVAEAIRDHDADRAREAMRRHVDHFGALYIEVQDR
jgi:GntR family transcriptional regulator, transcriptional repressor for pyruvate dehydrogenase complex